MGEGKFLHLVRYRLCSFDVKPKTPDAKTTYDPVSELVRINPVPSLIMEMKTLRIAVANKPVASLLGYSEEELVGKLITDLVPVEDIQKAILATQEPAPEGETEWRCRRKDRSVFYVKIKYRDTSFRGQPARFVVAIDQSETPFGLGEGSGTRRKLKQS